MPAPILEHDRGVEDDRGRVEAALEGSGVQEGLETRARLAPGLGGAVELRAGVAVAADEGAQCAVVRVERHQRGLRPRDLVEHPVRFGTGGLGVHPPDPDHVAACRQCRGRLPGPADRRAAQRQFGAVGEHHLQGAIPAAGDHGGQQPGLRRHVAQQLADGGGIRAGRDLHLLGRLAPAVAVVVDPHAVHDRLVGRGLQGRVDGGGDVVALVEHVAAEARHHLLADHLGHVRRVDLDGALVRAGVHRHRAGGVGLRPRHEAQFRHARQDVVVAPDARALRIVQRVAAGRELGDAGQGGGFVQAQVGELLAVVELRGRGHAVGPVPEEALVEVQAEDLVLAQLPLHLHRQQHLGELAGVAVLAAQEELAGDLLGNGGTAGDALVVGGRQQPDRARHALEVDPVVLVEAGVLRGQEGLLHLQGDVLDVDRIAAHLAEQPDQAAIPGIDVHRLLQLDVAQALHVRQPRRNRGQQDADDQGAQQCKCDGAQQKPAQGAGEAGHHTVSDCGMQGRGV